MAAGDGHICLLGPTATALSIYRLGAGVPFLRLLPGHHRAGYHDTLLGGAAVHKDGEEGGGKVEVNPDAKDERMVVGWCAMKQTHDVSNNARKRGAVGSSFQTRTSGSIAIYSRTFDGIVFNQLRNSNKK